MRSVVETAAEVRPADLLIDLFAAADREHEAGEKAVWQGLSHYYAAGEWLAKAKDQCVREGKAWLKTLKARSKIPVRKANRYKSFFEEFKERPLDVTSNEGHERWVKICGNEAPETTNWVDKQCGSVEWYTPPEVLERVREYFGGPIPLDPATNTDNATKAERFFTEKDDGLKQDWSGKGVFLNPPYGDTTPDWCAKIHEEADKDVTILALLPCGARFSTEYWQDHILADALQAVCFVRGRVGFVTPEGEKQKGNPYDSAIYGFNVDPQKFLAALAPLGKVLLVEVSK